VIAAIVVCVGAVVAIVIGTTGGGGSAASTDLPSTSTATVQIKRQDLVETDDEDGTLGYSDSREVINHLSGYVTWLPRQGSVIRPDHTMYRVDGSPVILMSGNLPAYRTLSASVSGADVREMERDLRALGYDPGNDMTVDRTWTSATTTAVKRWQEAHGLSQTGSIELGRIVFQPGSRRVSSVNATLGGSSSGTTGGGAASGAATTGASTTASPAQAQAAVFRTTGTTTTPAPTPTSPSTGKNAKTKNSKTEKNSKTPTNTQTKTNTQKKTNTQTKTNSKTGSTSGASGGSSGASSSAATPANTIMTTTSTQKVVTVDLDTTKSGLARLGAAVTVELSSGDSVHGRIASIGKVATSSSSSSGSGSSSSGSSSSGSSSSTTTATIKLTIRLSSKVTAFDQAPVTVRFEQNRVKNTLAIPVTALLAQPGGKFAVEVVEGSTHRVVPVTPGVYTSGYVQITGAGLQAGMRVTNAAVR
jgi:hypothetical protein